jgi:hypothetical protein
MRERECAQHSPFFDTLEMFVLLAAFRAVPLNEAPSDASLSTDQIRSSRLARRSLGVRSARGAIRMCVWTAPYRSMCVGLKWELALCQNCVTCPPKPRSNTVVYGDTSMHINVAGSR